MLTRELKEAITKLEQLRDEEQRDIAKLLEKELHWNKTFQSSQTKLYNLATEALDEYQRGTTSEKGW